MKGRSEVWEVYPPNDPPRPSRQKAGLGLGDDDHDDEYWWWCFTRSLLCFEFRLLSRLDRALHDQDDDDEEEEVDNDEDDDDEEEEDDADYDDDDDAIYRPDGTKYGIVEVG